MPMIQENQFCRVNVVVVVVVVAVVDVVDTGRIQVPSSKDRT